MSKRTAMKKVSGLLVTLLILSMLVPVLAAAAADFSKISFDGNNASGSVYTETYAKDGLLVHVYGPDGNALGTVSATYATYDALNELYEYNLFYTVTGDAYSKIGFKENPNDTIQFAVYDNGGGDNGGGDNGGGDNGGGDNGGGDNGGGDNGGGDNGGGVTPAVYATAISVDNTAYTLKINETHNTVVTATYSDGTIPDVSKFASYDSSQPAVATVDSQGVVTGVSVGSTVITVTYATYQSKINVDVINPAAYGGGGGGAPGTSTNSDGSITVTNGQVDATALKNAFGSSNTNVTLIVKGDTVTLPASGLVDAAKKDGATVTIKADNGTYVIPLSIFDFDALAKELGVVVSDLKITVSIKKLSGDAAKAVSDAVSAAGGKALADAIDFSITVEGKDGKKVSITSFGEYVKRTIALHTKPSKDATVVLFNPETNSLSFVPATISDTEATFYRTGNSVYTVVEHSKTFGDIAGHWAKNDIELLASKLIVDGVTDSTFEADRNITRAEFAALVVRSLGLTPAASAAKFSDVKSADWFAGAVGAAVEAGIVNGYEDGSFRPQAQITREELAAMVVRAYEFADGKVAIDQAGITLALSKFSDVGKIVWGQKEVAIALSAGLMNGMTDTTLETDGHATRAQSATMLKRFLSKVDFID